MANELALVDAIGQIRSSLDETEILEVTVQVVRSLMGVDRVCVLQFDRRTLGAPGQFVAEAVGPQWRSLLGSHLDNPEAVLGATLPEGRQGKDLDEVMIQESHHHTFIDDVKTADLGPEQRDFLTEVCQAQAMLSVPLIRDRQLWGGLYLQHCEAPHPWTADELRIFERVVGQITTALDHSAKFQKAQRQAIQARQQLGHLKQTQVQLIHSEKMSGLGHLVAGIAHEINNPVSFIYGNLVHTGNYVATLLDLIRRYHQQYPESDLTEVLQDIDFEFIEMDFPKILTSMRSGTDRIRKLVLSLRNFARLDEAEIKAVNIHDGIDNTLMVLRHRFVNRDCLPAIALRKNYGELPEVTCYPSQMNQVFLHLMTNALDAFDAQRRKSPYKPLLEVTTTCLDGDRIAITVKDNGPGIPKDIQHKIFDTFFTTKPPGQGTGLGLAISHQIVVEQHGGEFVCISEPGWGTFFQIIIPCVPPKLKTGEKHQPSA